MLEDSTLLEKIRKETSQAFLPDGGLDIGYLVQNCPRLTAAWNETIRLTASSASVRFVAEDTLIGGKILRKGHRVMIPNRQLHSDETIFGPDGERFDPNRFFENEKLVHSPSWRPFGGGITMCPGRFIAKQAAFTYTALLLDCFEVTKAKDQPFPKQDTGRPVLGVMANVPGTEFLVSLKPRKELQGQAS